MGNDKSSFNPSLLTSLLNIDKEEFESKKVELLQFCIHTFEVFLHSQIDIRFIKASELGFSGSQQFSTLNISDGSKFFDAKKLVSSLLNYF